MNMQSGLKKKLLITAVSLGFAMAVPVAGMASDTIKLGVAGAQSGDLASYGLPTVKAAELVVAQYNARGGINGKKVELLIEDDVCKPEVATNTATKLVTDGVDVVLGHICSGATKAALPIYKEAGIVVMSPSATDVDLTFSGDYPNFFRTIASNYPQAVTMVNFATDKIGAKKIAVIHDKGDYGKGLADIAKTLVEESNKAEVVLFEGVTPGAVDYTAIVQKIKRKGADAVLFGGYHPEASKIVSMMRKKRLKTVFISDDGVKDATFIKVAGKNAEGVYASGPRDTSSNPLAISSVAEHKKTYNDAPGAFYLEAYSAAISLLNAVEKAGSTDYKAIVNALRTEKVDTPVGNIYFDERGDAVGIGYAMYVVKDGVYVEVK
jgi:branched-chain amino acid transport system substrate-binding protein